MTALQCLRETRVPGLVLVVGISLFLRAAMFAMTWNWYLAPFIGGRPLPLASGLGVAILFGLPSVFSRQREEGRDLMESAVDSAQASLATLALCWAGTVFLP